MTDKLTLYTEPGTIPPPECVRTLEAAEEMEQLLARINLEAIRNRRRLSTETLADIAEVLRFIRTGQR